MNRKLGTYKTSQNLSSETLFHFTSDFTTLELILRNGFQARYIYEKLPGRKLAYLTKTICFCDIPLGLIKEHVNWYGAYGIGINRPIAKEYGFSPVLYLHSKSPNYKKGSSRKTQNWFENFSFTNYLKQIRGKQMFINDNNSPFWKWKTFYNEREWRYFPTDKNIEIIQYSNEMDLENRRKNLNEKEKTKLPYLHFDPNWIEYILIKDSKELNKLINILKTDKYKDYYDSLLTKVITFEQIQKDF